MQPCSRRVVKYPVSDLAELVVAVLGEVDLDCLIAAPIPIEEYSTLLVASQDVAPRQPMIFELFRKENSLAGSKIG